MVVVVVMGVSGSGKTAVGQALSAKLACEFADADDFHPGSNIDKMRQGIPLNDQDRLPWLRALSEVLLKWETSGVGERLLQQDAVSPSPAAIIRGVLACSALKTQYRKILASGLEGSKTGCVFVVLTGAKAVIEERMRRREHQHFFPSGLLQSQLDALQLPTAEEGTGVGVVHADISREVSTIVDDILTQLNNICTTCS